MMRTHASSLLLSDSSGDESSGTWGPRSGSSANILSSAPTFGISPQVVSPERRLWRPQWLDTPTRSSGSSAGGTNPLTSQVGISPREAHQTTSPPGLNARERRLTFSRSISGGVTDLGSTMGKPIVVAEAQQRSRAPLIGGTSLQRSASGSHPRLGGQLDAASTSTHHPVQNSLSALIAPQAVSPANRVQAMAQAFTQLSARPSRFEHMVRSPDSVPNRRWGPTADPSQQSEMLDRDRRSVWGALAAEVALRAASRGCHAAVDAPAAAPPAPPNGISPRRAAAWGGIAAEVASRAVLRNARATGAAQDPQSNPLLRLEMSLGGPSAHAALHPAALGESLRNAPAQALPGGIGHGPAKQGSQMGGPGFVQVSPGNAAGSSGEGRAMVVMHGVISPAEASEPPYLPTGLLSEKASSAQMLSARSSFSDQLSQDGGTEKHGPSSHDWELSDHSPIDGTSHKGGYSSPADALPVASPEYHRAMPGQPTAFQDMHGAEEEPRGMSPEAQPSQDGLDRTSQGLPRMVAGPAETSDGPASSRITLVGSIGDAGQEQGWYLGQAVRSPSRRVRPRSTSTSGVARISPAGTSARTESVRGLFPKQPGASAGIVSPPQRRNADMRRAERRTARHEACNPEEPSLPSSLRQGRDAELGHLSVAHETDDTSSSPDSSPGPRWLQQPGHLPSSCSEEDTSDGKSAIWHIDDSSSSASNEVAGGLLSTIDEVDSDVQDDGRISKPSGDVTPATHRPGAASAGRSEAAATRKGPGAGATAPLAAWLRPGRRRSGHDQSSNFWAKAGQGPAFLPAAAQKTSAVPCDGTLMLDQDSTSPEEATAMPLAIQGTLVRAPYEVAEVVKDNSGPQDSLAPAPATTNRALLTATHWLPRVGEGIFAAHGHPPEAHFRLPMAPEEVHSAAEDPERFFGSPRTVSSMSRKLRLVDQKEAHVESPAPSVPRSRSISPGQASSMPSQILAVTRLPSTTHQGGQPDHWEVDMPEVQVHTPTGSSSDESRTTLDPLTDDLSGYGSGTNEGASTIQPLSLHQHGSPLQGFAGGHSRSPFMLSTLPDSTGLQNDGLDSGDEATTDDGGSMLHSEMGHSSLTHAPPSIPTPVRPGRSRTLHRVLFSSPPLGSLRATFSAKPAAAPCPEVLAAGDMGEPSRASPLRAPPPAAVLLEQDPASVPRTQQGNRACASDVSGKWARRAHRFLQFLSDMYCVDPAR
ncbi:hypothetical protein WJX84_006081 [Apatococcus fuscideae]|uniref:Uncharacterized protein n=1 Tax=Apatococcus fuscideae TaxID=2026836 RepID=A0AAW1T4F2_9CHLO